MPSERVKTDSISYFWILILWIFHISVDILSASFVIRIRWIISGSPLFGNYLLILLYFNLFLIIFNCIERLEKNRISIHHHKKLFNPITLLSICVKEIQASLFVASSDVSRAYNKLRIFLNTTPPPSILRRC